jgi:hypothetical protein
MGNKKSIELGKKVIAVYAGDNVPNNIPEFITKNNIQIIKWKDLSEKI